MAVSGSKKNLEEENREQNSKKPRPNMDINQQNEDAQKDKDRSPTEICISDRPATASAGPN